MAQKSASAMDTSYPEPSTQPVASRAVDPIPSARVAAEPFHASESAFNRDYPTNCLVFVKNINPQTNKTTLKTLFSRATEASGTIDYVDFNKGLDSVCIYFF